MKVFILGNQLTGKSTLTKVIISSLKTDESKWLINNLELIFYPKVTGVEPHTAGIIPYHLHSPSIGYIILYDFAGQYEHYSSSHAAVLENTLSAEGSMIMIVVDISKPKQEIDRELHYWHSFVLNQCTRSSQIPSIILIGSHADVAKASGQQNFVSKLPHLSTNVTVTLDCTRKSSQGLNKICSFISTLSKRHHQQFNVSAQTHFMYRLLKQNFKDRVACKFSEILCMISQEENNALKKNGLLPTECELISQHLSIFNKQGQLMFLKNTSDIANSWIIFKKEVLLSEVNATIFAPEHFESIYKDFGSTGTVALSRVKQAFPRYDPDMLMSFMTHLDFCYKLEEADLAIIGCGQYEADTCYFFPALVNINCPMKNCQTITANSYKFGWCLQCTSGHYLTSRFLHVLLLRLAFNFALPSNSFSHRESHPLGVEHRQCNIWKNGIHWQRTNDVEVIVEVVEQSTAVLMIIGCSEGSEIKCIQQRSAVIRTILSIKDKFCKVTEVKESLLHLEELTKYPLNEVISLYTFPLSSLARAIQERGRALTHKIGPDQRRVKVEQLLHFEPYTCFTDEIIKTLAEESNIDKEVSDVLLRDCARIAHPNLAKLKEILLLPEHDCEYVTAVKEVPDQYSDDPTHKCFHVFKTWTKFAEDQTYKGLKEALDKYSIFCGRNPLVSV